MIPSNPTHAQFNAKGMTVDEALRRRHSIRAFKPDPVPLELMTELLELASRAPSSTNLQPWKMHVVTGDVRARLTREILEHRESQPEDGKAEFQQADWRREPFLSRMRKLGKDMYGLLAIPKGDQVAMWAQWGRNYKFFDAPVGMVFTLDKDLDVMSYVDLGLFIQSFVLLATSRGLGTCLHGAWHDYYSVTRRVLGIPDSEYVVVGLSLGYADESAPVNALVTEREPVRGFARFHGFETLSSTSLLGEVVECKANVG